MLDEDDSPEHLRSHVAPSTAESRSRPLVEGREPLTEASQAHLQENANDLTSATTASLHVTFEGAANKQEMHTDQQRQIPRELYDKS